MRYPLRQRCERKKVGARRQVLLAGDAEAHRNGAGGDQDEAALQRLTTDLDRAAVAEPGASVIGVYAALREALLHHRRHWSCEAAFEFDELTPRDRWFAAGNALPTHAPRVVDRLRRADEHLLRIAAAQRAGATERQMVGHRHPPSRCTSSRGIDLSRRSCPNHDE